MAYRLEAEPYHHDRECRLCAVGHRRRGREHVASQRKGMIATAPCTAVGAGFIGRSEKLPWIAYVGGRRVFAERRVARFKTSTAAEKVALAVLNEVYPEW